MEHSAKFEKVKGYFDAGLWTEEMVRNAVGKWITAEEAEEIITGSTEEGVNHDDAPDR